MKQYGTGMFVKEKYWKSGNWCKYTDSCL